MNYTKKCSDCVYFEDGVCTIMEKVVDGDDEMCAVPELLDSTIDPIKDLPDFS